MPCKKRMKDARTPQPERLRVVTGLMTGRASASAAPASGLRAVVGALAFTVSAAWAFGAPPRLSNISTRGEVGTGANIMIAGFVVGAGDPETVLIRAVGPSLAEIFPSGVSGLLKQPVLSLFDSSGNLVMTNKGWTTGNATAAIMSAAGAFPLLPKSADSALLATLPAGSYTAQVSGLNATTGVAL